MLRATLDVNVIVSSVLGPLGPSRQVLAAWRADRMALVTSEHIISHASQKLRLPRIAECYRISAETADSLVLLLRSAAVVIPIRPSDVFVVTGDPEDDAVLATVRLGRADYLVTGDRGLLALGMYGGARIVSPRDFLAALGH